MGTCGRYCTTRRSAETHRSLAADRRGAAPARGGTSSVASRLVVEVRVSFGVPERVGGAIA
jgi:hypothetical protein